VLKESGSGKSSASSWIRNLGPEGAVTDSFHTGLEISIIMFLMKNNHSLAREMLDVRDQCGTLIRINRYKPIESRQYISN
jgi:hypothetical protein